MDAERLRRRNRFMGAGVAVVVAGMVGLAFASVPLYRLFCQVTGYGGTVQAGAARAPGATGTTVTIRFNATVNPGLPWEFAPEQRAMPLAVGEEGLAIYRARCTAAEATTGIATYNVTPEVVGRYFHKTACFCFNEQTLEPGQQAEMPLTFWVDPAMLRDPNTAGIRTITISYSFFRTLEDAARSGALATAGPHVGPVVR